IGALRSPPRELRNELKYVQNEVKMNEISCLNVRHVEHKSGKQELSHITHSVKWVWVYKEPFVVTSKFLCGVYAPTPTQRNDVAKVTPLRVVITLRSSRGLGTMLL
ncbi:hypothetical protein Tco_0136086, partial [Tanacetum coccineum]